MDRTEELDPIAEYWIAHGRRPEQTGFDWYEAEKLRTNPWANGDIAAFALALGLIVMLILSVAP